MNRVHFSRFFMLGLALALLLSFATSAGAQPRRARHTAVAKKREKPRVRKPPPAVAVTKADAPKQQKETAPRLVISPQTIKPNNDLDWTDPIALRDTLFLSASARYARARHDHKEERFANVTQP